MLKAELLKPKSSSVQPQAKLPYVNVEETLGAPLLSFVPWTNMSGPFTMGYEKKHKPLSSRKELPYTGIVRRIESKFGNW